MNVRLLVAELVGRFPVTAAILFSAAGTIAWPAGWAFLDRLPYPCEACDGARPRAR